jgi:hypothetical protein
MQVAPSESPTRRLSTGVRRVEDRHDFSEVFVGLRSTQCCGQRNSYWSVSSAANGLVAFGVMVLLVSGCQETHEVSGGAAGTSSMTSSETLTSVASASYTVDPGQPGNIRIYPKGGEGRPLRSIRVEEVGVQFRTALANPSADDGRPWHCSGCDCSSNGTCSCKSCH